MEDLKILKTTEVAERYRVTTKTIRCWIDAGDFPPPLRIGRSWYWPEADLHLYDLYTRCLASCALAGEDAEIIDKPVYSTSDLEANVAAYRLPGATPEKTPAQIEQDRKAAEQDRKTADLQEIHRKRVAARASA